MGKWAELAARLREDAGDISDSRCNSDNRSSNPAPNAPIAPNAPDVLRTLPRSVRDGLAQLKGRPVPRISLPTAWPEIVSDALRLASEGWALQALRLGWDPLHLWGASEETPGLAVWLCARRILLLDATSCVVRDDGEWRRVFHCCPPHPDTVFLWELR